MFDISVLLAGTRGVLFTSALCSAIIFLVQARDATHIISAIYLGKVRQGHLIALGAFGWFIGALSAMSLTAHWLWGQMIYGRLQTFPAHADIIWSITSLWGFSVGFYIPILAMLWYKQRLGFGLALGAFDLFVGACFAWGAHHYLGA